MSGSTAVRMPKSGVQRPQDNGEFRRFSLYLIHPNLITKGIINNSALSCHYRILPLPGEKLPVVPHLKDWAVRLVSGNYRSWQIQCICTMWCVPVCFFFFILINYCWYNAGGNKTKKMFLAWQYLSLSIGRLWTSWMGSNGPWAQPQASPMESVSIFDAKLHRPPFSPTAYNVQYEASH